MKYQSSIGNVRRLIYAVGTLALLGSTTATLAQTPAPAGDKSGAKGTSAPMEKKDSMAGMPGMGTGGGDMRSSMMGMMKNMESMQMTGDADRDFAMMMKAHHQGAIDMAQVELKSGKDATMRAMAKKVIEAQQKEIREIDQWLAKRK